LSQRLSYLLVLLGAVLWGTTGTSQTFMPQTIHPLAVGASRLAIGGFTLFIILLVMRKIDFRNWPWKATIYAAVSMAVFQYLFFSSVRLTGVAIGTVVTIGSAPVFSGLIEWVIVKHRPTRVWLSATVLAIAGCSLLFLNEEGVVVDPLGIAMSLGAGFLFAVYALVNKDVDKIINEIVEVYEYLYAKKGYGYWSLDKSMRTILSATLVSDFYVDEIKKGVLQIALGNSINAIIIAQQQAAVAAACAASGAAAASSSS